MPSHCIPSTQVHPCHSSARTLGRKTSKLFPGSQGPSLLVPICFYRLMYHRLLTPPSWMFQNTQPSSHLHISAQAAPTSTTACICATSAQMSPALSLLYVPHSCLCSSTSTPCCLHLFPSTTIPLRAGTIVSFSLDPQCLAQGLAHSSTQ